MSVPVSLELIAGSTGWTGDKNDPTTLGWVTVGLGAAVGVATWAIHRTHSTGKQYAAVTTIVVASLLGLTTAGLAWIPAACVGLTTAVLAARHARRRESMTQALRGHWPDVLLAALAIIYLTFGIVAGGVVGVLGVGGAAAVVAAMAVHERWRSGATTLIVLGAVPFAVAVWWTVVMPATAILILAIGVPHVIRRPARIGHEALGHGGSKTPGGRHPEVVH